MNFGEIEFIEPIIEQGEVYFYVYAGYKSLNEYNTHIQQYPNSTSYDYICNWIENIGISIPLSNSILSQSRYPGFVSSSWVMRRYDFEVFYTKNGTTKNTGIIFNCN